MKIHSILLIIGLLPTVGNGAAATLVRGLDDGSIYVRVDGAPAVVVPASCVARLDAALSAAVNDADIEAAVATVACGCAASNRAMSSAIAAYAFTRVDEGSAPAVLAGAELCAAPEADVAPGTEARPLHRFSIETIGRATVEPCRSASPVRIC